MHVQAAGNDQDDDDDDDMFADPDAPTKPALPRKSQARPAANQATADDVQPSAAEPSANLHAANTAHKVLQSGHALIVLHRKYEWTCIPGQPLC